MASLKLRLLLLCFFFFIILLEAALSIGGGERIRRNSDSDVYSKTKEGVSPLKLQHAESKLKFLKERIGVIEKEIKQFSPEILETRIPEERTAFFKQLEISEGEKLIF